jgi:hypothetical protein
MAGLGFAPVIDFLISPPTNTRMAGIETPSEQPSLLDLENFASFL